LGSGLKADQESDSKQRLAELEKKIEALERAEREAADKDREAREKKEE
jgi:hypothetical protein